MRWRKLFGLGEQTSAERKAALNGVSLFFGALIGANMGASDRMPLTDYALIISAVALIVLYIQLAPVARNRWMNAINLLGALIGLYLLLIHDIGTAFFDGERPSAHIFVTICLWVLSLLSIELRPVSDVATGETMD